MCTRNAMLDVKLLLETIVLRGRGVGYSRGKTEFKYSSTGEEFNNF